MRKFWVAKAEPWGWLSHKWTFDPHWADSGEEDTGRPGPSGAGAGPTSGLGPDEEEPEESEEEPFPVDEDESGSGGGLGPKDPNEGGSGGLENGLAQQTTVPGSGRSATFFV